MAVNYKNMFLQVFLEIRKITFLSLESGVISTIYSLSIFTTTKVNRSKKKKKKRKKKRKSFHIKRNESDVIQQKQRKT